jgi:hypothetical protein
MANSFKIGKPVIFFASAFHFSCFLRIFAQETLNQYFITMKRIVTTIFLAFGLSLAVMAQCGNVTLLSGCVGACGNSYFATYTVTASDVGPNGVGIFCLAATSNSLCPSHDAVGTLQRNLGPVQSGSLDEGDVLRVRARVGDVLTVTVNTVQVDPNIFCFWFGETHFALTR